MLVLPDPVPGTADLRSPGRYLAWLAGRQWRTLTVGITLGVVWTVSQAVVPWLIGRSIDAGVAARDRRALLLWCLALLGAGLVQVGSGVARHRFAVWNWLQASMRSQQLVGHHVAAAGTAVAAGKTTGEVVSTVANDAPRLGALYDVSQRFVGAVLAFALMSVLLLRIDLLLGLLVLLGVPLVASSLLLVIHPLQARQAAQREAEGRLSALGADTVAGLRVLRGIGGEQQFSRRYHERSQQVRAAGIRVAGVQATLDAAQIGLPGTFVVLLTWFGAHATVAGRITPGQLVTVYGYAAFLTLPLGTATEALGRAVQARVAAGRIVAVLSLRPAHAGQPLPAHAGPPAPPEPAPDQPDRQGPAPHRSPVPSVRRPPPAAHVFDPRSGLRLERGRYTALVSPRSEQAAELAYRLARLDAELPGPQAAVAAAGPAPELDGRPVDRMPIPLLRRRILVSEAEPRLFTGTLRGELDPFGRHPDADLLAALRIAGAEDILAGLPEGLDSAVDERGRSFSGGQRQRLGLARAVLADPEVLVLVEPTSAVDAHTEARIAARLREARSGRTTLITTSSPLLLDRVDRVALLLDGRVVAEGAHRELLHTVPAYRAAVLRADPADDPDDDPAGDGDPVGDLAGYTEAGAVAGAVDGNENGTENAKETR